MKPSFTRHFSHVIWQRGRLLYQHDVVTDFTFDNGSIQSIVMGSYDYDVHIEINASLKVENMHCSCPHARQGNNCKHMAATLWYFQEDYLPYHQAELFDSSNKTTTLFNPPKEALAALFATSSSSIYLLARLQHFVDGWEHQSVEEQSHHLSIIYDHLSALRQYQDSDVFVFLDNLNAFKKDICLHDPLRHAELQASLLACVKDARDIRMKKWCLYCLCTQKSEEVFSCIDDILRTCENTNNDSQHTAYINFLLDLQIEQMIAIKDSAFTLSYVRNYETYKRAVQYLYTHYLEDNVDVCEGLSFLCTYLDLETDPLVCEHAIQPLYSLLEHCGIDDIVLVLRTLIARSTMIESERIAALLHLRFDDADSAQQALHSALVQCEPTLDINIHMSLLISMDDYHAVTQLLESHMDLYLLQTFISYLMQKDGPLFLHLYMMELIYILDRPTATRISDAHDALQTLAYYGAEEATLLYIIERIKQFLSPDRKSIAALNSWAKEVSQWY